MHDVRALNELVTKESAFVERLVNEVSKVIVGQSYMIERIMIGLLTGEVQLMFSALGPSMPHVRQGRMRAVAVTTAKRTRLVPDLPTVAETVPGFEAESAIGFFVPKKTPPAIVSLLNREIVQALKGADPQVLANNAVEVVGNTPDEFTAFIKAEMARMGPVIRSAHFSN